MSSNIDPPQPSPTIKDRLPPTRPLSGSHVSAHAAAAQFKVAADDRLAPFPDLRPVPDTLPLAVQHYLHSSIAVSDEPRALRPIETAASGQRLPLAWYRESGDLDGINAPDRSALMVKYGTVAGLLTCGAVALWLGMRGAAPPDVPLVAVLVPEQPAVKSVTVAKLEYPTGQTGVTTAQILAVAERFVATGDVLAARAMLSARAAAGEARAQFALAETYDPNMLSFWNAHDIEANVSYARLLYETARRNGLPEAQARLDALR